MAKKNFPKNSPANILNMAVGFTYPKAHYGKKIYVDFYVFDPATEQMRRFKKHFDSIHNKKERETAISFYKYKISEKLRQGWNPTIECENKGLELLETVFKKYENTLSSNLRRKTIFSYKSRLNILKEYISHQQYPQKYVYQLTSEFFVEFLDWLLCDREVSPRTRNNYKGWCASFCEWLTARGYIDKNPVTGISKIREDSKNRRALTPPELKKVFTYLKGTDKWFLLATLFEYYTFIRPTELSHLKIGDISIKNECVYISEKFSKNRCDGSVSLNRTLIMMMVDMGVFKYPSEFYLFGRNFKPAETRNGPDQFNKRWKKMRTKLNLDDRCQFYSLKDSGLRDLANAKGIIVARDQARHTDVATTNKYLQGRDLQGPQAAKSFNGVFDLDADS